jgi:hypothetical protein
VSLALHAGVQRPDLEANHLPPVAIDVSDAWRFTFTFSIHINDMILRLTGYFPTGISFSEVKRQGREANNLASRPITRGATPPYTHMSAYGGIQ